MSWSSGLKEVLIELSQLRFNELVLSEISSLIPYSSEYTSAIHLRLHLLKIFATITDQSASVNYTVCYMTSIDEKFIELWHSNTPVAPIGASSKKRRAT